MHMQMEIYIHVCKYMYNEWVSSDAAKCIHQTRVYIE